MVAMCPNPHTPADAEMVRRLLVEMRQYRDKYGIYAAEMLETARLLLEQPERYPRQAEAAACCIRQAVGEIFGDTRDYKEPLSDMVGRVADAKDSVQTADVADKESLRRLYTVVDELKDRVCSPKPEARLKEIFREASWIVPEGGPHPLILDYRRIKGESNKLLHDVSETRTAADIVRRHYEEVVDTLALIFLPTERLARIEQLAELPAPRKSDLDKLGRIMKNAYGFYHFASKMNSPAWFDVMEQDILKLPPGNLPWLLGYLAEHLKDKHVGAFVRMLGKNFDRWVSDEANLGVLGFVGYKLGDGGFPWLVKTLQASEGVRMERDKKIKVRLEASQPDLELIKEIERMGDSIRHLDNYARRAFLEMKQPNPRFVELAEHLLSSASTVDAYYKTNGIPAKLVECMGRESATRVIEILVRELRAGLESRPYLSIPHLDSVAGPGYGHSDEISGLVTSLCRALAKARDLGMPTPRLIGVLGNLPEAARPRFRAWLYSRASDITASEILRYVVDGCGSRPPSDEDGLLLDRLKQDGRIQDISEQIASLLGRAPDTKKMAGNLLQWRITKKERWRILWARKMRRWVELPDVWKPCLALVDRLYETERTPGSGQAPEASGDQDGVALPDGLGVDDPLEVARKLASASPDANEFPELTGGHPPVPYLENAIRRNPSKWAENPVGIIRELHHPEYVACYFRGLAEAKEVFTPYADRIISAVKSARMRQRDGGASGSSTFYRAGEFLSADVAGMRLIEEIVKNGVSLGRDALADVWYVVGEAMVLPVPETVEQPNCSIKYLHTVDGLPHVRAARTLVEVIRYAKQNSVEVPNTVLVRLTEAVRLTGQHGVDYRACIGPQARLIHAVEPEWFVQNEQYLFGGAASAELGRVALDMCMIGYEPDAFILEKYRDMVLDAVKRDVPGALQYLLYGLLWWTRGYDPEHVAKKLLNIGPECVSKAGGWDMFDLLRKGGSVAEQVRRAVDFWDSVLKQSPKPEALVGFGWYANVKGIDQGRWEELMLRTCEITKKLDWSEGVAKRISRSQTITDTGWQILVWLFSIDLGGDSGYKERVAAEHAMKALCKTAGIVDAPESRSRLREVLVDHGFTDAAKL